MLVVASDISHSEQLLAALNFYNDGLEILNFASWEVLVSKRQIIFVATPLVRVPFQNDAPAGRPV
ncbi:MAG: hypothetical protein HAW59_03660 [Betaproteobacteria bacterium]|nr:hypothetical protein [Betaproteobacteria bacterium]